MTLKALVFATVLALAAPAWADYNTGELVHCGNARLDDEGWLRVVCHLELEPYAVKTIYVWFDREIPDLGLVEWEVNGAAYPIIVNPIRGEARGTKRTYIKYRVFNIVAVEQYVTLHWLVAP